MPPLNMKVLSPDGKSQMELQDRVLTWFERKLVDEATTPSPEFRPNQRVFADNVKVNAVVTSPETKVYFTTDGSTPTAKSQLFKRPVILRETTVIKALAIKKGMKPSGVVTVRFLRSKLPPVIVGPNKTVLKGKVGQPLTIKFISRAKQPIVWRLAAHHRHEKGIRFKGDLKEFGGLSFDPKTATVSGTPTRPFVYTLQAQAAWKPAGRASTRSYVLHVTE